MALDITTPNLDPSQGTELNRPYERNLTTVKFESVIHDMTPEPKKPGFFSRFLGALGGFAPLAYAFAPFTMGLSALAGVALQGAGAVGQKSMRVQSAQQQQALSQRGASVVSYPGMMNPGVFASYDPTIATIADSRQNAIGSAIQQM